MTDRFTWQADDLVFADDVGKFNPSHDERGRFAAGDGAEAGSPIAQDWAKRSDAAGLTSIYQGSDMPTVYSGIKEPYEPEGYLFVTRNRSAAEFHGAVHAFAVKQGARIHADTETNLTDDGQQTLFGVPAAQSSAVIHISDLEPVAVDKFNPSHDEHGRFASGGSAGLDTAIASALREKGGFTFNPLTVKAPEHGYAVGGYGTRDVYDADSFAKQSVEDFMARNQEALKDKFLGGWIDKGKVYLDVTKVFPEDQRDEAVKAGKERDQIAIADLSALNAGKMDQAFIDTGGTGKAEAGKRTMFLLDPRAMSAEEMHAAIVQMIALGKSAT